METIHEQTVENALIGLTKLLKNVSYYPDGHPSLNQAISASLGLFSQAFAGRSELKLTISRQGFSFEDQLLGCKSPLPATLAERLFFHKIKTIIIFPELTDQHLLVFARSLCKEPTAIANEGGITTVLDLGRVSTIAINELNPTAILERKTRLDQAGGSSNNEAGGSGGGSDSAAPISEQEISLNALITRLNQILQSPSQETEGPFLHGLRQLIQTLQQFLARGERIQALRVLNQLDTWTSDPNSPQRYVTVLYQAIRNLSGEPLIEALIENATDCKGQTLAQNFIHHLDETVPTLLINRLIKEIDNKLRKFLSQQLVDLGEQAFPALIETLDDERWFVVRNSVAILSESRNENLIPSFVPQLNHPDGRVVNEAIRALARIKIAESSQALVSHLKSGHCDFPNQVILALGALGDTSSTPELHKIALRYDPFLHEKATTKVAIMAMSEIAAPQSSPTLIRLLQRPKFFKRREYIDIRCQAALALGRFDDPQSLKALKKALNSSHRNLASASKQALRLRNEVQ